MNFLNSTILTKKLLKKILKIVQKDYFIYYPDTNSEDDKTIILDSIPEALIFKKLKRIVENRENVHLIYWGKNPGKISGNNVSFEYLDDDNTIKKAFFDFIVKIENSLLFLEVKDQNDIDINKTANIEEAMNSYFKKGVNKTNLFLAIVNVKDTEYTIKNIYCKDEKLSDTFKKYAYKFISNLDYIIDEILEINNQS
ncbi:hypothetical protein [Mycoplasma sp. SG1]|uniref:hypothetical protein n=1 Tax=Mycoplasma sp. SG1 TaxID=2810348 RepID=UPI00202474C3|nr:hypothetical protein [Mycoplasma sp. SG1]URM52994.1 hypothetical protein JRW51_01450 [Mycoplasma sp. SG1]